MSDPKKPHLRRAEVEAWLDENCVDVSQFRKLVKLNVIERLTVIPGGRGYYLRSAVFVHLIKPFRDAEARLASGHPNK